MAYVYTLLGITFSAVPFWGQANSNSKVSCPQNETAVLHHDHIIGGDGTTDFFQIVASTDENALLSRINVYSRRASRAVCVNHT